MLLIGLFTLLVYVHSACLDGSNYCQTCADPIDCGTCENTGGNLHPHPVFGYLVCFACEDIHCSNCDSDNHCDTCDTGYSLIQGHCLGCGTA